MDDRIILSSVIPPTTEAVLKSPMYKEILASTMSIRVNGFLILSNITMKGFVFLFSEIIFLPNFKILLSASCWLSPFSELSRVLNNSSFEQVASSFNLLVLECVVVMFCCEAFIFFGKNERVMC